MRRGRPRPAPRADRQSGARRASEIARRTTPHQLGKKRGGAKGAWCLLMQPADHRVNETLRRARRICDRSAQSNRIGRKSPTPAHSRSDGVGQGASARRGDCRAIPECYGRAVKLELMDEMGIRAKARIKNGRQKPRSRSPLLSSCVATAKCMAFEFKRRKLRVWRRLQMSALRGLRERAIGGTRVDELRLGVSEARAWHLCAGRDLLHLPRRVGGLDTRFV